MVSTRGVKFKFSEGEKVLCYEPDPTKAKVLYDSKVLEVKSNKDQRGRKAVEYLIHFQGWNSSWDRCVCEDYVLKDTEENRQLQRDLAERAQLQLGAYLYRRERKKRDRKLSEKVTDSLEGKRSREGDTVGDSSGDDSSCSRSQRDDADENLEDEEEDEVMAAMNLEDFEDDREVEDEDDEDKVPLQLSDTLKRLLELDHDLINTKNKVVRLPAEPNVVTILEGYLKHCAVNQLCGCSPDKPQCRMRSRQAIKSRDVEKIRRSLVVCMEVLHGVRTFFDETLGALLLYNNERLQYRAVRNDPAVKQEQEDYGEGDMSAGHLVKREVEEEETDGYVTNYESTNGEPDSGRKRLRSYRSHAEGFGLQATSNGLPKDEDSEDNFPLAHIKQELPPCNSVASTSSRCSSPAANQLGRSNKLLNAVLAWHLVPDSVYSEKPVYASLVYGATHLARLFVKLPDLLSTSNMSEKRLKVVLHYLDNFLSYLEDHSEWFGEGFYKDNFPM